MTSLLCGSIHGDCSPSGSFQYLLVNCRFLWRSCSVLLLPLGISLQQKPSLKESVQRDMLMLHNPASLLRAVWTDTWPKGPWSIGRWNRPIRLSKICSRTHRDGSREGWVLKRKGCVEWIPGWIFSYIYTNEKTEKASRLREATELSKYVERNTDESLYGERTWEQKRRRKSPSLSHRGAVCCFYEMAVYF